MIPTNIHVMTSQGHIHVLCVINGLQQKETWWDTEPYMLEKTCICVLSVRSVFQLGANWRSIWIFIPANTSAQNVANVVWVEVNWQCTGEVIQERNRLNVVFVTNDLHGHLTLLDTAEFTVETIHSDVTCVAKYLHSLAVWSITWEFTRERNLTSVHCVTDVSPTPATCRDINVVYTATATVDHIIVLTVESNFWQTINWSVISVFTLMQSRTHVDTVQTVLCGIINSRHICWSHTMKVLGSRVTFVRRNSAAVVTLRGIYFNINKLSRMFAVNVQSVSLKQLHWNLINWYIPICSSFAVVNVVNILNINIMLLVTLRDVVMIDWVLSVFLIHMFLITE